MSYSAQIPYKKPNPAQERGNQVFGVNVVFSFQENKGGLLYPNPTANLVGE
jgi:hypothetical protein